jgi:hypothetical protein
MRGWAWFILAASAAAVVAFWWFSEQGRALERDSYDFEL